MGTNFYWKEIPQEIKNLAQDRLDNSRDSIFRHIGKRSASGLYCLKCGITINKQGTARIHDDGPDFSLLMTANKTPEQIKIDTALFKKQQSWYDFSHCPCCGTAFSRDNPSIIPITSFTWTMMIHKKILKYLTLSNAKVVVDEYDEEYTALEFLDMLAENVKINFQNASIFS